MADLTQLDWQQIPRNAKPDDFIARNFTVGELTVSELALRRDIDNSFPSVRELRNAVYLAREVMQPVRNRFGPFSPNSVFRSQELERVLKGKPHNWISRSDHTTGCACDIEVPSATTRQLAEWVAANLEFDQLIMENFDPRMGASAGWVHVSLKPPGQGENRREVLSYVRRPRSDVFAYVTGLVDVA